MTSLSENLFKTIFELQPKESSSSDGSGVSREDKVKEVIEDLLDKIPEEFNIAELNSRVIIFSSTFFPQLEKFFLLLFLFSLYYNKSTSLCANQVEDRTPYVIVAFQECDRMNSLCREMRRSLEELDLGLKVHIFSFKQK